MIRILLIEDNEANRDMLGRRLGRKGYDVSFAVNGVEGVEKALADKPDLILMDIDLPKLCGWDATRVLRETYSICELPIIALTALAMPEDRQRSLDAGCNGYQTKPVDFTALTAKIEQLVAGSGAE